jgi:ABC-type branched-subunit amino acid transport system substrate-binding protein
MIKSMRMKRLSIVSAVIATGAMVLSTLPAQAAQTTGVTAKEIHLGISSPTSGSAGLVYGNVPGAMKAYFDYINANGGVNGRKIKLTHCNDKYTVRGAATCTFDLVYDKNVFALVGALGTATHQSGYKAASMAVESVPDLFVNSGWSGFNDKVAYPTTFMVLPTYAMEAKVMAKVVKDNFPGQATFLVAQNDEFGDDARAGFGAASHKFTREFFYPQGGMDIATAKTILGAISAVPGKPVVVLFGTGDATVAMLKAAEELSLTKKFTWLAGSVGADANTLLALKVKPETIDGVLSASFMPDAKDLTDPYVKQFVAINTKYRKGKAFDNYVLAGMNSAMLTVQALRAAGPNLTRDGLMKAIETKGSTFASAGLVPLGYSATSRIGYNGYWVSQINAKGEGKPYGGKLVIYTTDSGAGVVTENKTFVRPTMPKNGIPTNK